MNDHTPESALADHGIPCESSLRLDGVIHRFRTRGDHDSNSWYVFHQRDGLVCGAFGCWKRQFTQKWSNIDFGEMTGEQKKAARLSWQEAAEKQKKDLEKAQADARSACNRLLNSFPPAKSHPYLAIKMVKPAGRVFIANLEHVKDCLAIPLQDEQGVIHSFQFIAPDGTKRFYYGGRVQGCFFKIDGKSGPVLICEGYATGCSVHESTGWTTLCALNCGNLLLVCQSARKMFPDRALIICADNDQFTDGNPGMEKAQAAAKATSAAITWPEFADEALADKPTDFNDLHLMEGEGVVKARIFSVLPPHSPERVAANAGLRLFNIHKKPPLIAPRFTLRDTPICTPGNLTAISAPPKTAKSSFIGAMFAAVMAPDPETTDCLSVRSSNPERGAVIHIDTEQSPYDHYQMVVQSLRRANISEPPPWLMSYCLTGFSPNDIRKSLDVLLQDHLAQFGSIHSVILDGIADMVDDVNDPKEGNALITGLHANSILYYCPIIGVIHLNPGTEKTRGHLGSQLERKAETNLRLERQPANDSIVVWSDKNRRAPISKNNAPCFIWDDAAEMHVSTAPINSARNGAKFDSLSLLANDLFSNRPSMRYSDLVSAIQTTQKIAFTSAERKFREMKALSIIKTSICGLWEPNHSSNGH